MRALVATLLVTTLLAGCTAPSREDVLGPPPPDHPLSASTFSWEPYFPTVGEPVYFRPTVRSSVPGDELLGLKWDLDGVASTDGKPVHTFRRAGDHEVTLTIQTSGGGRYTLTEIVEVLPVEGTESGPAARPPPGPATDAAPPIIGAEVNLSTVRFSFSFDGVPQSVRWEFGDGTASTEEAPTHTYAATGTYAVVLRVLFDDGVLAAGHNVTVEEVPFLPHVIVAVPDSGVNPYHEAYRRPDLTAHPCTYIQDYPCDIPALNLTLDAPTWQAAFEADEAKWAAIEPGDRFWIPGTNLITVLCQQRYSDAPTSTYTGTDHCILDDSDMHGTGTTSSVLSENPEALLIFEEGNSNHDSMIDGTFPIDVISYSWGAAVPLVGTNIIQTDYAPFFVAASGNEGAFPVVLDGQKSHPSVINVGGADGASRTEPGYSGWKTADFVSEYCRPTAQTKSLDATRERYCGTSFAAPTFAGALSKVILELRKQSGYTGSIQDGMVDPILKVSKQDVRRALELSATYETTGPFDSDPELVPLVDAAPYYQYGWGYVAREQVPDVLDCILRDACGTKDAATEAYMGALMTYREATAMA